MLRGLERSIRRSGRRTSRIETRWVRVAVLLRPTLTLTLLGRIRWHLCWRMRLVVCALLTRLHRRTLKRLHVWRLLLRLLVHRLLRVALRRRRVLSGLLLLRLLLVWRVLIATAMLR